MKSLGSAFAASCAALRRHNEPFVSWDLKTTIPFLVPDKASGRVFFRLGTWNTETGAISIEDRALFSAAKECRVFWDGGDNLVAIPRKPGSAESLDVKVEDQRLTVLVPDVVSRLPSGLHPLLAELPSGNGLAWTYHGRDVIGGGQGFLT